MKNNKSNKIIKNLLFVFLVILIIIGICFFNYKMDPYRIFKNKYYMQLNEYPREMIYTVMKSYKNKKNDTVILGSSETITLFNYKFDNSFNNVSVEGINFKQYEELLDAYLKLHPETKRVIIVPSLINVINDIDMLIPEFDGINYSLNEYQRILFSYDSTIQSFNILKDNISNFVFKYIHNNNNNIEDVLYFEFYPKQSFEYKISVEALKELENKNFKEINSLIQMLNKKNLDYAFIIPPYNAVFLSLINSQENCQNYIDNFRRFLVSSVPSDKKIYDFAFINRYTSSDLFINNYGLYFNLTHPSFIYGAKIHKVLYNNKNADKSIYFILNKDNIESIIDKENKLLQNYIENNKNLIKYFKDLSENQNEENFSFFKRINFEKLNKDSIEELEYIDNKI